MPPSTREVRPRTPSGKHRQSHGDVGSLELLDYTSKLNQLQLHLATGAYATSTSKAIRMRPVSRALALVAYLAFGLGLFDYVTGGGGQTTFVLHVSAASASNSNSTSNDGAAAQEPQAEPQAEPPPYTADTNWEAGKRTILS